MVPRKVLVAVESAHCLPALRVAAEEAARRRCGVHLLHVLPPAYVSHPRIGDLELVAGELQHAGAAVLGDATQAMRRLLPDDLVVSTELCHGTVVSSLVQASAHACLLVLQHREQRLDGRGHLLPTIQSVVSMAQCPVLVVPVTWQSEESSEQPLVVAGVEDVRHSRPVVEAALAEASRRGARVRLVHGTVGHSGGAEDLEPAAYAAWLRREHRELAAELSELCGSRPDVAVELEVVPEAPAAALVARARGAAVVVIGRGRSRIPFGRRPGPVTADVLRHATCPALVVEEGPQGTAQRHLQLSEVAGP
jgi:nucleotide-binding universal stress UspA family protein